MSEQNSENSLPTNLGALRKHWYRVLGLIKQRIHSEQNWFWTEEVPVFPPQTNNQKQKTPQKASHHDYVRQEEEIDVEEEWVKSEFESMFDQIINMRQDESNWIQVPRDVQVFIGKKKSSEFDIAQNISAALLTPPNWIDELKRKLKK